MNPGIYYLYEYSNTQKLRNVGFLKITRYYHSCTIQLNARGIPVSYADTVRLCAFYLENDLTEVTVLTEITCANHALSARLASAESQFSDGRTLHMAEGLFLPLSNGHILAAAAPGILIDAQKLLSVLDDSSAKKIPRNTDTRSDNRDEARAAEDPAENAAGGSAETEAAMEPEDHSESATDAASNVSSDAQDSSSVQGSPAEQASSAETDSDAEQEPPVQSHSHAEQEPPVQSHSHAEQGSPVQSHSHAEQEPPAQSHSHAEQEPSAQSHSHAEQGPPVQSHSHAEQIPPAQSHSHAEQEPPAEQTSSAEQENPGQSIRKIRRSELTMLPRRYWHLANNSFLLHGYHNYNHLILIEKDGHYWLGVPGIYDPHEARAARLFGFPQFTDSYNKSLRLSDDECNPQESFGYWCCYISGIK